LVEVDGNLTNPGSVRNAAAAAGADAAFLLRHGKQSARNGPAFQHLVRLHRLGQRERRHGDT
jgi:hypothetical protein